MTEPSPIPSGAWRTGHPCPQCAQAVHYTGTGRPPTYCSQRCRRHAYDARHATRAGLISREVIVVASEPTRWVLSFEERLAAVNELRSSVTDGQLTATEVRRLAYVADTLATACAHGVRRLTDRLEKASPEFIAAELDHAVAELHRARFPHDETGRQVDG